MSSCNETRHLEYENVTKEDVINGLLGILVIANVNVRSRVMLENI